MRLIDFEFATTYKVKPDFFSDSYELSYIPNSFLGDIPKGHANIKDAYDLFWKNKLLLTKEQFIKVDNKFIMQILMIFNFFKFKFMK